MVFTTAMENTPGHSSLRHSGVCPHMTTGLRNSFVSLVSFCQVEKLDLYLAHYEHLLRTKEGADGGGAQPKVPWYPALPSLSTENYSHRTNKLGTVYRGATNKCSTSLYVIWQNNSNNNNNNNQAPINSAPRREQRYFMIREQDSGSDSVLKLEKKSFWLPPHTHTWGGGRLWVICELKFLRLNDLEFLFLGGSRTVGNRKWLKQTKAF